MRQLAIAISCFAAMGCASTRPERMLGYTDHNLFVVEHHDPQHGGRIVGTVCAVDVELDARLQRDGVALTGYVGDRHQEGESMHMSAHGWTADSGQGLRLALTVRDRAADAERDIFGVVGDAPEAAMRTMTPNSHGINLKLTRDAIRGTVGTRAFDLRARGDDYVGTLLMQDAHIPFVLRGAAELWAMPAAAQATILPLLLSCTEQTKVIQLVDLRQSDLPPPSPPRWWTPRPDGNRVVEPSASPALRDPSERATPQRSLPLARNDR